DVLEALPGQVRPELGGRLGQYPGADPAGLGDVVVAGVAPLEALVLAAVGLDQLVREELLLGGVAALGVVLVVGRGGDAPGRDRVGLVLDVVAEDRAVAGVATGAGHENDRTKSGLAVRMASTCCDSSGESHSWATVSTTLMLWA